MASSSNNEAANSRGDLAIAVIGCGYWGPNLARNFYRIPSCNLKAVSDPDPERLADMETRFPGVACVADSSKILSDPEISAVVVATPVRYHYEIAKAALVSGKHVLIEKPMASSAAECEELNQIAAKNGLTLMVGHTFLYSEAVNVINEKIISGDIGDVLYINAQRLNLGLFQKDINVAWDLAPHDLSIILHLLRDTPENHQLSGQRPHIAARRGRHEYVAHISGKLLCDRAEQLDRATQGPADDDRGHEGDDRLRRRSTARKNQDIRYPCR